MFQPVAVETLGGLGHDTLDFLRELGSRIGSVNGNKRAPLFLRQRLPLQFKWATQHVFANHVTVRCKFLSLLLIRSFCISPSASCKSLFFFIKFFFSVVSRVIFSADFKSDGGQTLNLGH